MHTLGSFGLFVGRICIAVIFLLAGIGKFMDYHGTAAYMASKGMTMVPFFLYAAAIVEILGSLAIIFGCKARWGAILLLLFLIPTTLIFHDFWNVAEPVAKKLQMMFFMKNLAIFGGLLYIAAIGGGAFSLDRFCKKGQAQ